MGVRCGIDLGTTYSAISWYDSYNTRVDTIDLESADGAKIIRSIVYYPAGGPPVVGDAAWNAARQFPERVVVGIKRSMGTGHQTPAMDGITYSPQEVSAEILRVLSRDAQIFLGEEVKDVVITVPAYFGDNERAATEEAGRLAGLNVLALLPEPHAAVLAFAVDKAADIMDRHLLVYDLGGGAFDVTLIHATAGQNADGPVNLKIETLCKDGNAQLGGLDWDRALAEIVAEKIIQQHGIDVWQDPKNEALLLDNCEKAKRQLGRMGNVSIIGDLANHQVDVTLVEFEDRTRDKLLQTEMLLTRVLKEAEKQGIRCDQIEVMLTGGPSRMPMVRKMIEGVTGCPPLQHRNPELLVTIGAAYWAHLLQSGNTVVVPVAKADGTVQKTRVAVGGLTDTTLYSVGVEVLRADAEGTIKRYNAVIIPANAEYGREFEKEFRTAEDGMTEIPLTVYKGDASEVTQCEQLMEFAITGLPPGRPKGQLVKVKLSFDQSGIIRGSAIDLATGRRADIVIDRSKPAIQRDEAMPPNPPPSQPSQPTASKWTLQEVIHMFESLDLLVCDDQQAIEHKYAEKKPRYLRDLKSPDPSIRHAADRWTRNFEILMRQRPEVLRVVYEAFAKQADMVVAMAHVTALSPAHKDQLKDLARQTCQCDDPLTQRLVADFQRERGLPDRSDGVPRVI